MDAPAHLNLFVEKMERHGLQPAAIDTFAYYYRKVVSGEKGLLPEKEISPVASTDVAAMQDLADCADDGEHAMTSAVWIVLNGGLGTSMGLAGPKSLLIAKADKTFLDLILKQAGQRGVRLLLMNSFSTRPDTEAFLADRAISDPPRTFLQHKFPKILEEDLSPAVWPADPALEWNPPGHGDIYTALLTSGMLDRLLDEGVRYAFISNSDNLGAAPDAALLGYFSRHEFPFMMEAAERTPADVKGGHLARRRDGRLVLRESAQCPDDETDLFQDIARYAFFNTNNLWINLGRLRDLFENRKTLRLPMILNPKRLDPRDDGSPPVYQVETAMGSAVSLFENAAAVSVPRTRFFPVKKCNDLLLIRSDYVVFDKDGGLTPNSDRATDALTIDLDPAFYGKIDDFNRRFPKGVPSLARCESLKIMGDVRFEENVVIRGKAVISNPRERQAVVEKGAVIEGNFSF